MKTGFALILLCAFSQGEAADLILPCLPKDVTQDALVSGSELESARGKIQKPMTVLEALLLIEARCQDGKPFDKTGREIYFFHLIGCWGNPPEDYQERLTLQAEEIQQLKKKFTVLEITCAPTDPRQIY